MSDLAWNPLDIIFAKCPDCHIPITWKRSHTRQDLGATCCGWVYNATFDKIQTLFFVRVRHVDMTNVVLFPIIRDYDNAS